MFKPLLVAALVASLAGTASAQTVGGVAAPSAAAPKATATPKATTTVAPKAVATVAPSATPAATLAPAPAKLAPKSFVLPTPTPTPAPTPKPVSAVGGNRFDLFATVPVSENNGNKNLGLAVGYRLVRLGDLALSPLVNFNYIQNNPYAEPGLALTGHVARNYDLGVAEVVRPRSSFSLNRTGRNFETAVVLGVRF